MKFRLKAKCGSKQQNQVDSFVEYFLARKE